MTSFYKETFGHKILDYTVWPVRVLNDLLRECIHHANTIIARLKEKGIPYEGAFAFTREDLSFEWSVNLDTGVETVTMYRIGIPIPLLVIDRQLPWAGKEDHDDRVEFNKHHMAQNGADNVFRIAAESVLEVIRGITERWLKTDLTQVEVHDHTWAVRSLDRSEVQ